MGCAATAGSNSSILIWEEDGRIKVPRFGKLLFLFPWLGMVVALRASRSCVPVHAWENARGFESIIIQGATSMHAEAKARMACCPFPLNSQAGGLLLFSPDPHLSRLA